MSADVCRFVQKHLPDSHLRSGLLQILAESMIYAQRIAADKWTLTCNRDALRLNVGMIEVLVFTRNDVNIVVDEGVFNQIDAVTDWQFTMTGEFADEGEVGVYASVPRSAALFAEPGDAVTAMAIVLPAHQLLIRHAAQTRVNPAVKRAHQADLAAWVCAGNWTLKRRNEMTTPQKLILPMLTLDTLIMSRHASAVMCHETEGIAASGSYTNVPGVPVDIRAARDAATRGRVAYRPGTTTPTGSPRHTQVHTFVYNQTTLAVAEARIAQGYRVAILNLASATSPGGGWLKGSQAQEESLARASALVYTLRDDEFYFDATHHRNPFYNDTVLVSPAVPFFRHHNGQFIDTPWQADVITSAAVHAKAVQRYMPDRVGEIALHMAYRTQKVFQVATTIDADILILGAWGCGAFGNDPEVIAQIMCDMMHVVDMRRYVAIDFAVADMYNPPLNYQAFATRFDGRVFAR